MTAPTEDKQPIKEEDRSFFADLFWFLLNNPKWWIVPTLGVLLLVALLVLISSKAAAPFIYSVF